MDFGCIIVGRTGKEIAKAKGIKDDYDVLTGLGLDYAGRGYEDEGYDFLKVGNYEAKTEQTDIDEGIFGKEVVCLGNEAILYDNIELLQRINEAKRVFKEITGIEGKTWIIGYQT